MISVRPPVPLVCKYKKQTASAPSNEGSILSQAEDIEEKTKTKRKSSPFQTPLSPPFFTLFNKKIPIH